METIDYWKQRAEAAEADHDNVISQSDELYKKLMAAEAQLAELRAEQAEHDKQIATMEGKFNLAKRALDSKTERCDKAEAELARRDAAAGEPAFYIAARDVDNLKRAHVVEAAISKVIRFDEIPAYTSAPPAVLPPEWEGTEHNEYSVGKQDGWNECRAAILRNIEEAK